MSEGRDAAGLTRREALGVGLAGMAGLATGGAGLLGVGGVPTIVQAASVRGTRANSVVRLGMVGMGIRGRNIMRSSVLGSDRCVITAMCDVDRTRLNHYADEGESKYADRGRTVSAFVRTQVDDEVYASDDVDAVVIATPDHWHATQCLHALAAGKHVYCEKPLTHTLHEGRVLTEAAEKSGLAFLTGSQQRTEYGHRFSRAVDLVRNGAIGRVQTVNVGVGDPPRFCDLGEEEAPMGLDWDRWLGPAPERGYHSDLSPRGVHGHYPAFRRYIEYSGGYLADMGAHHYDIAHWAMEMDGDGPMRVLPPAGGFWPDQRGVRLVYPNGVVVTHGGPNGTTFTGTGGTLHVDRGRSVTVPGDVWERELEEGAALVERPRGHLDHFIDCVHGEATPICGVEAGARTAAACQLVNLCYELRRGLTWDASAWRFVDDEEANELLDYERREGYGLPVA